MSGDEHKVWTAAELDRMTLSEREALFDRSIVRDLADVPAAFLARVRENFARGES